MTADELIRYINCLSSSGSPQSVEGNFGMGAKIAAAAPNPAGVLYRSWKDGEGNMIRLQRDPQSGKYGLQQWQLHDGSFRYAAPLGLADRPDGIAEHGTQVVLWGATDDADTMKPPPGTPSPSRWISKYLNARYFRFPESVTVKAREGWEYPQADQARNHLRTITGQEPYLAAHSVASGQFELAGATAYWWILRDDEALKKNSGFIESTGHVAALYRDELYEMVTGRPGAVLLQRFGVLLGHRQVVIYVQPHGTEGQLTTNTSGTALLIDSKPLPWAQWAEEFREKLPPEIKKLVEQKLAGSSSADHASRIRERLQSISSLLTPSGRRAARGQTGLGGCRPPQQPSAPGADDRDSVRAKDPPDSVVHDAGSVMAARVSEGRALSVQLPEVKWVSAANGTREPDHLEDRAAQYLPEQNLLLINEDYFVLVDMIKFLVHEFEGCILAAPIIREKVRCWYVQNLVETVIGARALRGRPAWAPDELATLLSAESLTAVVMQRYQTIAAVKRELAGKFHLASSSRRHRVNAPRQPRCPRENQRSAPSAPSSFDGNGAVQCEPNDKPTAPVRQNTDAVD